MMKNGQQIPDNMLRDIKPLVEIPDNSIYIYYGLIILAVLVILVALFLIARWLIGLKRINKAKEYLKSLNSITWTSPKKAAYAITHYGRLLATDDRRKELFDQLLPMLESYKYKKEVDRVDSRTQGQFELYKKVCNESV